MIITGTAIADSSVFVYEDDYDYMTSASALGIWEYNVGSLDGGEEIVVMAKDGTDNMSYPVRRTVSDVEVEALTDADVSITSGSIEFVYTFAASEGAITYAQALEAPYYLNTYNSTVTIAGTTTQGAVATPVTKRLSEFGLEVMTGTATFADASAFATATGVNFIPNRITIDLVGANSVNKGEDEWEFTAVVDLSEAELALFDPPLPDNMDMLDDLAAEAGSLTEGDYTVEAWAAFETALTTIDAMAENTNTTVLAKIEAYQTALAAVAEGLNLPD